VIGRGGSRGGLAFSGEDEFPTGVKVGNGNETGIGGTHVADNHVAVSSIEVSFNNDDIFLNDVDSKVVFFWVVFRAVGVACFEVLVHEDWDSSLADL